jgi:xanthine dehydrogenase iron-sulfur cluster and FAD-binding subunit A
VEPCVEHAAGGQAEWRRCATLEQLLAIKAEFPQARIIGGNTEVGIEMHIKGCECHVLIDARAVRELSRLEETAEGLQVWLQVHCRGGMATSAKCLCVLQRDSKLQCMQCVLKCTPKLQCKQCAPSVSHTSGASVLSESRILG